MKRILTGLAVSGVMAAILVLIGSTRPVQADQPGSIGAVLGCRACLAHNAPRGQECVCHQVCLIAAQMPKCLPDPKSGEECEEEEIEVPPVCPR